VLLAVAVSHSVTPSDSGRADVERDAAASDFDCVPSHWQNQAAEATEPTAMF